MKLDQVALQLYTCRDLIKTPAEIAKTLKRLRTIGYTAVEVCGTGPISEEDLNEILDGEGLVCCSTHEDSNAILNTPELIVERLNKLRCKATAYPFPADVDLSSRDSVRAMISKLQHAGEVLHQAGQTLSYHNHHHEFRKVDGKIILDMIYDGTSKDALKATLDTYWVQYGGGNIFEWIQKLTGRLPRLHIKDYRVKEDNAPQYCEIGSGNLNFKAIIAAAEKAGCKWFIVEQDVCPGDPVDSLEKSFRYIQENLVD